MSKVLLSVSEAESLMAKRQTIVLDGSIDKVGQKLDNGNLQLLPHSRFFDIEGVFSDHQSGLPHTMPSAAVFEAEAQKLGINQNSQILLYDRWGVYSSPRAWWMFRYMGFEEVYILNGGLPAWEQAGKPTVNAYESPSAIGDFKAEPQVNWFIDLENLKMLLGQEDVHIVDARSAGRFAGTAPEPRPGLKSGHIPGSSNIPFDQVLDGIYFKDAAALAPIYAHKIEKGGTNVFSCGSGITASVLALGAYELGIDTPTVFDGSWSEYGADPDSLVERD